ncbi:MAG: exodeoxyribonuclease VII large subunit [Ilumatobacter coccineus]|uniref:Exodeoxyribonuclease 7 large subunit n=1 Tax=Ilumatobacter coccineus TaxID=467094 RepID=A0A2G6K9H5_9ACTN|nr:MAG: exodeoxyribonuclease VII large subunit [Ilumatobacter coccineus]
MMDHALFSSPSTPSGPSDASTYSVSELARAINDRLRAGFPDGVWVRGEIDGLRRVGAHTYFQLVEDSPDGHAVISVALFAPVMKRIRPVLATHRIELADGMKVRIRGDLDLYAKSGRLSLKMSDVDPHFTLGDLSAARDQLIQRLVAAGLFDANRRLVLSPVPIRVGVITSIGSAAWHDFHDELAHSGYGFELEVCDTRVQGEHAPAGVVAALATLAHRPDPLDCVVIIRGGGSRTDLAAFDAEEIATAIATSPLPVLTGIGHEIDRSVADEVAYRAFKTPTACAGGLIDAVAEFSVSLENRWQSIARRANDAVIAAETRVNDLAHRISRHTTTAVERADQRLVSRCDRLVRVAHQVIDSADDRLAQRTAALVAAGPRALAVESERLDQRAVRLDLLNPANLLRRGWSITRTADRSVVRSVDDLRPGDHLITSLADGEITSRIEDS